MAEGSGTTLEYTPTWVVALVCSVIVIISFAVERILHYAGKYLKKKNHKPLLEALLKIKEELMLLGFISLLLSVFQSRITQICISEDLSTKWLPCKSKDSTATATTAHFQTVFTSFIPGTASRLLDEDASDSTGSCKEGKVPILSATALHHLHIFIFVLAVVHVTFCVLIILFGGAKIRQWKHWEDSISKKEYNITEEDLNKIFTDVRKDKFIMNRFWGIGKGSHMLGWLHSFFKQFYGSVTKTDYMTLRLGFIMTHCRGNLKYNFHKCTIRALEADFKKVVGISWYLWLFVVIFLLLNVYGWHAYFWIAFMPFILLLAVGAKMEHVITQLANEVAEKHSAILGPLVVNPSDEYFWFHRPRIVLFLIHLILFQNSFEIAIFFWIWVQYGFKSCMMGKVGYIIPRLVIGVFVQFFCSYSTLPLYAIVTQMGSSFKKAIFEEHIQESLDGWVRDAKKNKGLRKAANGSTTTHGSTTNGSTTNGSSHISSTETTPFAVQMTEIGEKEYAMEEGNAGEIEAEPPTTTHGHK